MAIRVLIISSDENYGAMVMQTLDHTGIYDPVLLHDSKNAIAHIRRLLVHIAILDVDQLDIPALVLGAALQDMCPGLRLVLLTTDVSVQSSSSAEICGPLYGLSQYVIAARHISREKLLESLQLALALEEQPNRPLGIAAVNPDVLPAQDQPAPAQEAPHRLQDVNHAAQQLTNLLLATAAHAALIVRSGQLWAYAGHLSQEVAKELAQITSEHLASQAGEEIAGSLAASDLLPHPDYTSDLTRFVHLTTNGGEYLLYALRIGEGMLLGLAFDTATPFRQIRAQAVNLARALFHSPEQSEQAVAQANQGWLFLDGSQSAPKEVSHKGTKPALAGSRQLEGDQPVPAGKPMVDNPFLAELEFDSNQLYQLRLACALVPRLPQHRLQGELKLVVEEWMTTLCLAFGWRLEMLQVDEGCLCWIVQVGPDTSPAKLLRLVRQHTSLRIFDEAPSLAKENPSGDFWARGFLVIGGARSLSPSTIQAYIQRVRQRQGTIYKGWDHASHAIPD